MMKKLFYTSALMGCFFIMANTVQAEVITEDEYLAESYEDIVTLHRLGDRAYYVASRYNGIDNYECDVLFYDTDDHTINKVSKVQNKDFHEDGYVDFKFDNKLYFAFKVGKKKVKIFRVNSSGKVTTQTIGVNAPHNGYVSDLGEYDGYYYIGITTYNDSSHYEYKKTYIYRTSGKKWQKVNTLKNRSFTRAATVDGTFYVRSVKDTGTSYEGYATTDGTNFTYSSDKTIFKSLTTSGNDIITFKGTTYTRKGTALKEYKNNKWSKVVKKKILKYAPKGNDDLMIAKVKGPQVLLTKNGNKFYNISFKPERTANQEWLCDSGKVYGEAVGIKCQIEEDVDGSLYYDWIYILTTNGDDWYRVPVAFSYESITVFDGLIIYPQTLGGLEAYPKVSLKKTKLKRL